MWNAVSAILYPTVLVAEDSQDTRIMLKRAFELKGYRVFEAEDGQQALDMATAYRPSLIVIDLNMPVLDGLETVKNFREARRRMASTPRSLPSPLTTFTAWKKPRLKRLQPLSQQAARFGRARSRTEESWALLFDPLGCGKSGLSVIRFLTRRIQHVTPSNS